MAADATARDRVYYRVREATRTWGRATARWRMYPDFLIVGAQRCGTTSLFKTLRQHPNVVPPVLHKGVHYFDMHPDAGLSWYLGHFPTRATGRRVGGPDGSALTGESSPYYLFHPHGAARIAATLPDVKALVLVRDPVARAHSAHAHESARGFETLPFEAAIDQEEARVSTDLARMSVEEGFESFHVQHHAYVARGQYAPQIERMAAALSRQQVLVVDSGRLFTDPEPEVERVLRFLGLPVVPDLRYERHNARPRPSMDPALASRLDEQFAASDAALTEWLGTTPSWRE